MSVILHPDISTLNPDSLLYSVYVQLYNSFFNAQVKKDNEHPYGIVEGDESSIRLHNTAYNFANAIAGAVSVGSSGSEGAILLDYIKKTGGNMSGMLRANNGFEAGILNTRVLEAIYSKVLSEEGHIIDERYGVQVIGDLHIGGSNLYIDGKQFISYYAPTDSLSINTTKLDFSSATISSTGELLFGSSLKDGVYISPHSLLVNGNEVYHAGNANVDSIDWNMLNGKVAGKLLVEGSSEFRGLLNACSGVELGSSGTKQFVINNSGIRANDNIEFSKGKGIKYNDSVILRGINEKDVQIGAAGNHLILGSETTNKIRLFSGISDIDNEYLLLSKYGAAYFPDSLTVRHNFGTVVLSTYRVDANDEGFVAHKKLRFGDSRKAYLHGVEDGIGFVATVEHITVATNTREVVSYESHIKYIESTSMYRPMNRFTDSFLISTQADFIQTNKPVEAKGHIGIDNSYTRLTNGGLIFNSDHYLQSGADGIKHYGNSYFMANIGSANFASGFAGYGWAVMNNKTTGNIAATFDELTIRKKMRIYELEVQKISATNGSLWVSDNCGGDTVIKL